MIRFQRIADRQLFIGGDQRCHKISLDRLMDNQPPRTRAALTSRAHRPKKNTPQRQFAIGRGRDNNGIVPPKLEQRATKTLGEDRAHAPPHRR